MWSEPLTWLGGGPLLGLGLIARDAAEARLEALLESHACSRWWGGVGGRGVCEQEVFGGLGMRAHVAQRLWTHAVEPMGGCACLPVCMLRPCCVL